MHKISQVHSEKLNSPVNKRRNYYDKEKFEMKNTNTTNNQDGDRRETGERKRIAWATTGS